MSAMMLRRRRLDAASTSTLNREISPIKATQTHAATERKAEEMKLDPREEMGMAVAQKDRKERVENLS